MRFKAALLIILSALASIALVAPQAEAYHLKRSEAKYLMGLAMKQEFGASFRYASFKNIKCKARIRSSRIKCRTIAWSIGDVYYEGKGTIWLVRKSDYTVPHFSYKIDRINGYCQDTGGSDCVDHLAKSNGKIRA